MLEKDSSAGRAGRMKTAAMLLAVLALALSFAGSANPAKVSPGIYNNDSIRNKQTYVGSSLFETTGSYLWGFMAGSRKATEKLLDDNGNRLLFAGGALLMAGIAVTGAASFISKKSRMARRGVGIAALCGAAAQLAGLLFILAEYFLLRRAAGGPDALAASLPPAFTVYLLLALAMAGLSLAAFRLGARAAPADAGAHRKRGRTLAMFRRERELWVIAILAVMFILLFVYVPMFGNIIGFVNFKVRKGGFLTSIAQADWTGLFQLKRFFNMNKAWLAIRNTLVMGFLNITVGFAAPIILALLFNEIRVSAFKRVVQTISYMPHFVSWVVVASLALIILGNDSGIVNNALRDAGAIGKTDYIPFLNTGKWYWYMITSLNIWKGVGWGSIIYISAITGIDQQLYEAGAIDGLGRLGMVRHITLPGISTTIMMLFILGTAGIISGGMEQHLLLGNQMTIDYYETIDTFVYRYFSGTDVEVDYSLSTAVGMLTSGIAIVLLVITNAVVRKATDMSLF